MKKLLKRLKPRVYRTAVLSGTDLWALGVETWVQEHERNLPWGSTSDGAERYLVLHLGGIDVQWSWEVRS